MQAGAPTHQASGVPPSSSRAEELILASRELSEGIAVAELSVPGAHCGGCMAAVENALTTLDGVIAARFNLSTRRATVKWDRGLEAPPLIEALARAGFEANFSPPAESAQDAEKGRLFRATAVAGFAAMNIMLLSVSVWAGAGTSTRDLFHLLSAIIAIPAVAYSGRIFFGSAWSALRAGRSNMDVPISVGILLTLALSLFETLQNGAHAYFDAATSLVFFLLIGRTLEHMMRLKARTAVLGLARMMPRGANVIAFDGGTIYKKHEDIMPGELVVSAPGDRIALDGEVTSGAADLDASMVTGEAVPVAVRPGDPVLAGMLNLNGSLVVRAIRASQDSFVTDMVRLMEAAEHGRTTYRRIADRAARLYSPVVHSLALLTFVGWIAATGDWHRSLIIAISVLIITCPCALGLAVPMVHVLAARRLFENGIALKDGTGLERLAEANIVAFDKTGTLTTGEMSVKPIGSVSRDLDAAIALARHSQHPVARAIAACKPSSRRLAMTEIEERPGEGVQGRLGLDSYRLGRAEWALSDVGELRNDMFSTGPVLAKNGAWAGHFEVNDPLRAESRETVEALRARGLGIEILSGDVTAAVSRIATALDIDVSHAGLLPGDKVERLNQLRESRNAVLMVGDGLNDAPALAAAHVSMAPAGAADIGRAAADLVFFGNSLMAVNQAVRIAHACRRLVRENLALAVGYNVLVIPVAIAGLVTPLMAAIAMSLSSILVIANALRISREGKRRSLPFGRLKPPSAPLAAA